MPRAAHLLPLVLVAVVAALVPGYTGAQSTSSPSATASPAHLAVQARLVVVPVVVFDKKGLVTTLSQSDFSISVEGKPQTIRYFDRDADQPLTVGLLVDVSRSQSAVLGEEQKASQAFLDSFLRPAAGTRAADKAFILQFAHGSELLQDVTASHPLLAAGLKEIGTEAPGSADDTRDADDTRSTSGNSGNQGGSGNPSRPGYGGYPGRGGSSPNGSNNGGTGDNRSDDRARGGTVLYDSLFLASDEVLRKQTGRRALVVLTDGVDRHSRESLAEAIEAAQRADTVVYAIYYKGEEHNFNNGRGYGGPGGGYGGYPGYGRQGYPGSGGRPGSDGTYAEPDGRKILERICSETGGRVFLVKGKGSVEGIYTEIGDELRAQYRLGFTPTLDADSAGFHALDVSLTNPANKKLELQTRQGYYTGAKVAP